MTDRAPQVGVQQIHVGSGAVGVQINQLAPPPPQPSQIFPPNLPLSALCVGRDDEIEQLKGWLIDQVGNVALIALQGIGGLGKTRLALEFFRRHQKDFPGGIFWLNAENETQREDQFYNILCLLESTPPLADLRANKRDIGAMLGQAVARYQPGQRRLWVLDNVPETPANQRPVDLHPWRPVQDGQTSCLITSRHKVIASGLQTLEVQPLSEDAAVQLLTQYCKLHSDEDLKLAREIAEWVGYLPLALELISCTLQDARTLNDWHQCIREEPSSEVDRVFDNLSDCIPTGLQSVATVFLKSYQLLTPKAQTLARIFAHFGPDPIPTTLKDTLGELASDLHRLQSRHFITGRSDGFVGSMHRVLAAFLRHVEATETENDRTCARKALIAAMHWDLCCDPRQRHIVNPIRQHALAVIKRKIPHLIEDATLYEHVAQTFYVQGEYHFAHVHGNQALEVRRRVQGQEHPNTLASMNDLAMSLQAMGDLKGARTFHEEVLDVSRRVLGEEHRNTLTSMNNLAMTLSAMGDLKGAQTFHEKILEVRRRVLGKEHPDTLASINNLAQILQDMGNLKGARTFYEKALKIRRRVLGEEHPDTLMSINDLACVLYVTGYLKVARAFQEKILEVSRRVLGEEHPYVLTFMNNLAITLKAVGDLKGARTFQEKILEIRCRVLPEEHPDTLISMNNLAGILKTMGDLAGARALYEKTLEVHRRVLGDEHPHTLTSMSNLAHSLHLAGEREQALSLAREALAGLQKKLGVDHPHTKALQAFVNRIIETPSEGREPPKDESGG